MYPSPSLRSQNIERNASEIASGLTMPFHTSGLHSHWHSWPIYDLRAGVRHLFFLPVFHLLLAWSHSPPLSRLYKQTKDPLGGKLQRRWQECVTLELIWLGVGKTRTAESNIETPLTGNKDWVNKGSNNPEYKILTMYPLFQNNDPLTLGYHGYPSHSQVRTPSLHTKLYKFIFIDILPSNPLLLSSLYTVYVYIYKALRWLSESL